MAETYMKTDRLSVGYNGTSLIHDICVDIKRGEIVTLIGPNGAGKSTILKSITRQLKLIGGRVQIAGEQLEKIPYKKLSTEMAVVLTERMKPELMTCHDIVATGRYPYTGRLGILSREDEDKVEQAMAAVHAEELGSRDFNAISDGQRQRVLLARAICQEPEIIILDEPTSFLDIRHKLELLSILRTMARQKNITVVMSLHEIDLAQKISDKILCVKGDHIAHYGEPESIFTEEAIRELYGIEKGYFDPLLGSLELPKPEGDPKVLVLSNCGTGVPVYRKLQKQGRAFVAGPLATNDVDYQLARLLAAEVLIAPPFEPIPEELLKKAKTFIDSADEVIDAGLTLGSVNQSLSELLAYAREQGKLREILA